MGDRAEQIISRVREYRTAKGWSQEELARRVQVRRQAIYDIESGRYLPNTAVALKLARQLGCKVEELFQEPACPGETLQMLGSAARPGQAVNLSLVRDRLVGISSQHIDNSGLNLKPADGLYDGQKVRLWSCQDELSRSLLLTGCDPALELLAGHALRAGKGAQVHWVFSSSGRALSSLAAGLAHVASIHFHNAKRGEANLEAVAGRFAPRTCRVIGFSLQEEGLMVASGNPLGLRGVADLAQSQVRLVNREPGAALRQLLDHKLAAEGISPAMLLGYDHIVNSHAQGAWHVASGAAEAALGLRMVAEAYGLSFVPLSVTRHDLVIPKDLEDHPTLQILLNLLQSARVQAEIAALPGYDVSFLGREIG